MRRFIVGANDYSPLRSAACGKIEADRILLQSQAEKFNNFMNMHQPVSTPKASYQRISAKPIVFWAIVSILLVFSLFTSKIPGTGGVFFWADLRDVLTGKKSLTGSSAPQSGANEIVRVVSEESAVIDAVKKARPAVVSVIASEDVPVYERYFEEVPFGDQYDPYGFFRDFDMRVPKYRQKGTETQRVSAGTGFILSEDGYMVTNKHVVSNEGATYTVIMNNDVKYTAKVLARDPSNDIAILKIETSDKLPFLEIGDSDTLQLGQTAIAIGYALGKFDNSVSKGVISGLYRSIDAYGGGAKAEHLEGIIQTDAAINPGNSGGPLLNLDAQVIGMNVAIVQDSENIGFALPINDVRNVYTSVKESGKIVRPFLGVRYVIIDEEMKRANNLPVGYGALIVRGTETSELAVVPGSPADKGGLVENDIILEVDGVKIDGSNSLAGILRRKKVGDTVKLKILHQGKETEVSVILEERKSD